MLCRDEDFNAVRGGCFDDNPFVQEVIGHIRRKSALGDNIIARLKYIFSLLCGCRLFHQPAGSHQVISFGNAGLRERFYEIASGLLPLELRI